jgi:hypothetical protein
MANIPVVRPSPEDIPANSIPVKIYSNHKKTHWYSAKSYVDSCTAADRDLTTASCGPVSIR